MTGLGHSRRFCDVCGTSAIPPILLQNSLLRCHRAIIESEKPASRIRYCALWLILESILRVGSLENSFATQSALRDTNRCPPFGCYWGHSGHARAVKEFGYTGDVRRLVA